MARAKRKPAGKRASGAAKRPQDAIALLKADHRQVETWFEQFEKSRSDERKGQLAKQICDALTVHATIEEEIFYPAFLAATEEEDLHHEAEIEHAGAKRLIAEIEASGPEDDYYDARVTVLSEMIKHHVKEEEQPDGMFAKARKSGMDLQAIGEQLAARKAELEGNAMTDDDSMPMGSARPPKGERSGATHRMSSRS
jgi:hemerythrin superfamily protein